MRNKIFSVCLTCLLAVCGMAWGQATTSLHGVVTDPSGASVPNARITLSNSATGTVRTTLSNHSGRYSFPAVFPGIYTLQIAAKGFQTYVQTGLQLRVSLPAAINISLQVGAVSTAVHVSSRVPLLNTTNASMGQTMGATAIENLPIKAENTNLLLSFQPGVVYTGQKGGDSGYRSGAVDGERSDQNNITLDGVSNNNEFENYGFSGVLPTTPFSVQEFRVSTSNYGATQGRSAGAQITLVTRGGTNQFHGSLYEFNRSNIGEANDFFLKTTQLQNCAAANTNSCNQAEHLVRNVYGGTLGGPVWKNKLFFFFNYEGHRQNLSQSATRVVPSASLRQGIIQYQCSNADAAQCPGGSVTGVNGQGLAVKPGYYALGPSQLQQMDPLNIGPSQAALKYLQSYPEPNNPNVSDGVNYSGYTFAAPTRERDNWYIGRIDYRPSNNQSLFFRGTATDDNSLSTPFLPGDAPQYTTTDLSKGFVLGHTYVFGPTLVNNARYGLTRQSVGIIGDSSLPWVEMRGLSQGITRSGRYVVPVHNLVDTLSWQKGSHNFQLGGNLLFIRRFDQNDYNSYSYALTNSDWASPGCFSCNTGSPLDPVNYGYPAVSSGFEQSYDFPLAAMMGIVSEVGNKYNYSVSSLSHATALSPGTPLSRHWATDDYNLFAQDTWQMTPDISLVYGLNYQYMTPITETHGQEVTPNINMGQWFAQRTADMNQGIPSSKDPLINFAPAGSYWNRSGLYNAQSKDFAPRLGVAWSPHAHSGWLHTLFGNGASSIRAGWGIYYDVFGPALALNYDASGAFGLTSTVENPAQSVSVATAPRLSGMNTIPTTDANGKALLPPPPASTFPVTYPVGAEAIARGIDQSLQSPYSNALDFSIERNLPDGITLDLGYVGHFGRRLIVHNDIATPLNLKDPKSGIDYFSAAARLSQLARQNVDPSAITAAKIGPTAQYWEDLIQPQSSYNLWSECTNSGCPSTSNMLAAVYSAYAANLYNETSATYVMDLYDWPMGFKSGANTMYNSQYSSLYVDQSIGWSNYNAFELGLHKRMSNGLLFGFNYTYSKALDLESMPERGNGSDYTMLINPWAPGQLYGPSDFDMRHQFNAYWVADLPFGRGKAFGGNVGGLTNALIGGWQLSGTFRATSGLPSSAFYGYNWPTNWEEMGLADTNGQPMNFGNKYAGQGGAPNVFQNPTQAHGNFIGAFPGESGVRNNIRGDGYFGINMGLDKRWHITENQSLEGRWSVYNVTNTTRFDVNSAQLDWAAGSFGNYTNTLTQPRVMEFAMLYRF